MSQHQHKDPVITIDGESATGKGTVGQLVATYLGWNFLDSGALYRVLALATYKHSVALDNEPGLQVLAEHLDVQFMTQDSYSQIILEGEEVTSIIRSEKIGNAASIVAALPAVRAALLSRQRAFQASPGLVADGRDMGTIVFPDAELKFFLLASLAERAKRRYHQLQAQNLNVTLGDLVNELRQRDQRDQQRVIAPLKPAEDAICINTDHLSIEEVVEKIIDEIQRKKAFPVTSSKKNEYLEVGVAE